MTTASARPTGERTGPRVCDATNETYDRVRERVEPGDGDAFLERRGGRTRLVVR